MATVTAPRTLRVVPTHSTGEGVSWNRRGLCTGRNPDEMFVTGAAQRDAAKLCQGCPVRMECLADALDNRTEFGVWGGMTERQRRALLKQHPDVTSWAELLERSRAEAARTEAS